MWSSESRTMQVNKNKTKNEAGIWKAKIIIEQLFQLLNNLSDYWIYFLCDMHKNANVLSDPRPMLYVV